MIIKSSESYRDRDPTLEREKERETYRKLGRRWQDAGVEGRSPDQTVGRLGAVGP